MLQVALSQGWEVSEFDALFNESIEKHPYYVPLYFIKAGYMAPRWHGSTQTLNSFVNEAVNMTHDKLGEQLYARLNWSSASKNMFVNGQTDWARMKKGFEEILVHHPDAWNINNFAKFACVARDFNTALKLDKLINGKPLISAWFNSKGYYDQCLAYAKSLNIAQ